MNLLYVVFGNEFKNHLQAYFSIYSFLTRKEEIASVNIITDSPGFYKSLEHQVNLIVVNESILKEWRGPHDFFWRIKIKALELIGKQYPDQPVLYIDSDTFLYQPLTALQQGVAAGKAYMHEFENLLSQGRSKTEKRMWQQVGGKTFGGVTIRPGHGMWNAGVVLIPNKKNGEEFALATRICDDMCEAGVTRRLVEQFALSVSLEELYQLHAAEESIAHYWSNKDEWNAFISRFFNTALFYNYNQNQITEAFSHLNLSTVPVIKKARNTAIRLQRFIEKLYPPREITYVKQ